MSHEKRSAATLRRWIGRSGAIGLMAIALLSVEVIAAQSPSGAPGSTDRLPLWEVSHEGRKVYLLGSVHMLRPEAYPLHRTLYEAFDAAEVVAFELNYDDMMAAAPAMLMRGVYADGRTLRDALPADVYADFEARVSGIGIPIQAFQPMKPWMAGLTLTSVVMQAGGFSPEHGIDQHFFARAKEAGKEIEAFETVDEQIAVFDGLSHAGQVAFLRSALEEMGGALTQMAELTDLWVTGDSEGLAEILTQSTSENPELFDRLLLQRNRNWIPQVESMLRERGTSIVIVGMAHLVGEGSVLELLGSRGFEVKRVAVSPLP